MQLVQIFCSFQGLHSICVLEMMVYMEREPKMEDIFKTFYLFVQ